MLTTDWSSRLSPLTQLLGQMAVTKGHLIYPLKNGNQREKGVNTEQFALTYIQNLCACDEVSSMQIG